MKIPLKRFTHQSAVESLVASAVSRASQFGELPPVTAAAVSPSGATFHIETLLPIGVPTGDGRKFKVNSITHRELPIPLLWQFKTGSGHDQSVVVGRIDSLEITPEGAKNARGVFDTNPYAREVERMIRAGFLRGVSADLDMFSATEAKTETLASAKDKKIKNKEIDIDEARIMGATVVAMPAFQEVLIKIDENSFDYSASYADGEYVDGELEKEDMLSLVASAVPVNPPREWFQRYSTNSPMPLTVEDNGRVYGYLALWNSNHLSYAKGQKPPHSSTNYQYFRSGVVRTAEGVDVTVGNITLTHGHASMSASANEAVAHYDDTRSAVVDVVAGEDQFGIWLAGALRPDVTENQIRALRASGVSGDWRPINGRLELVAACAVNVPGFPTTRAMVASGQITALVAAGVHDLEVMRTQRGDTDSLALKDALSTTEDLEAKALAAYSIIFEDEISDLNSLAAEADLVMMEDDLQAAFSVFENEDN